MSTFPREQSGINETTPLLPHKDQAWAFVESLNPDITSLDIEVLTDPNSGRIQVKMPGSSKKAYFLYTTSRDTGEKRLNPNLSKEIQRVLRIPTEDTLAQKKDKKLGKANKDWQKQKNI